MDKIESEMEQLAESLAKSTSQDVSETVEEDLEKAGKGPGSRGGKVIGHTKSGKPIYEDHDHESHASFSHMDHQDAISAHHKNISDIKAGKKGERLHLFHEADDSKKISPKRREEIKANRDSVEKHVHSYHQKKIADAEGSGRVELADIYKENYDKAKESMHHEKAMANMSSEDKAKHEDLKGKRKEAAEKRRGAFDTHGYQSPEHKEAVHAHDAAHNAVEAHEKDVASRYKPEEQKSSKPAKKDESGDSEGGPAWKRAKKELGALSESEERAERNKRQGETIDAMAKKEQKMKKSEQIVLDAAMTLGREGLKKALPNLSDEQKELLHTVLEKAKAMSFDEEVKGPGAQVVVAAQEKVKVAKDHDEDHDADDEKLVKPAAADIKHQGDNSPEGIEGQMIKGEPSEEILQDRADMASKQKGKQDDKDAVKVAKMEKSCDHDDKMIKGYEMLLKSMPEELEKAHMGFDKLVEKLKTEKNPPSDPAAVAAAIGRKKYGKQAFQSMSKSAPLCKSCESEEKEPKMKSKIEAMKAKGLKKSECLSYAESKGYDLLAKGIEEFWGECTLEKAKKSESKEAPMNSIEKEEEKEMEGQKAEAKKENASQKPPKKEDEKKEKMEKSIPWTEGTQALLKASTRRGQNAHYTVEAELLKSDAETREILKKGEYLNAEAGEEFMKSVRAKLDRKVSINDILEKGLDMSTEEVDSADRIAKAKPTDGSFNVKSFDEAELIKSMGLTQEQAEAIFKK